VAALTYTTIYDRVPGNEEAKCYLIFFTAVTNFKKMAEIWLEFRKMWVRGFKRASLQPHKFSGLDAKWPFTFNLLFG